MSRIIWTEDSKRSKTEGGYEYYYTPELKEGLRGKVTNISLIAPNAADNDLQEIGIFDGTRYYPLTQGVAGAVLKALDKDGCFPIIAGESIYGKISGTTVDADVKFTVLGYTKKV